jgi:hypothetical protein
MDEWTEIRRKVLVEGASKRSIIRDYGVGHQALAKILANPEPPGYQMSESREKAPRNPDLLPRAECENAGQAPAPHARDATTSVPIVAGGGFEPPTFGL